MFSRREFLQAIGLGALAAQLPVQASAARKASVPRPRKVFEIAVANLGDRYSLLTVGRSGGGDIFKIGVHTRGFARWLAMPYHDIILMPGASLTWKMEPQVPVEMHILFEDHDGRRYVFETGTNRTISLDAS